MKINRTLNTKVLALLFLTSLLSSCGIFKKKCGLQDPLVELPNDANDRLGKNAFEFTDLNIKARAQYETPTDKQNFTMLIKMKKDSAIWISISGFGFEVVRALVDNDSLKVMNKMTKSYFVTGIEDLKNLLHYEVSLAQLQSLLVGNSPFPASQYTLYQGENSVLFTKEAFIKSLLELNRSFRINQNALVQDNSADSLVVQYSEFQKMKPNGCLPGKIEANYGSGKTKLVLQYNSVSTTKIDNLPFRIPDSYTRGFK